MQIYIVRGWMPTPGSTFDWNAGVWFDKAGADEQAHAAKVWSIHAKIGDTCPHDTVMPIKASVDERRFYEVETVQTKDEPKETK
jgi:hypothetical protein